MKFNFCKDCGGKCCTGPYISKREARLLSLAENTNKVPCDERGKCIFLGVDGCTLTDDKVPLACRIYPLMPTNSWWVVRLSCPGWRLINEETVLKIIREFEAGKEDWDD